MYRLSAFFLLAILLSACKKETCAVSCGANEITFYAIGFTKAELVGTVNTYYGGGTSFNDTITLNRLSYPSADTGSDTIRFGGLDISYSISDKVTIYLPDVNVTHSLSDFKLSGPLTEQHPCHEGGHIAGYPVGVKCSDTTRLTIYNMDGLTVNGSAIYVRR